MGCDYYIVKVLQIYYEENEYLEFELNRERGYYHYEDYDEDADDYKMKIEEYIKDCLTPQIEPIILYKDGTFNKPLSETKYKTLVEKQINKFNIKWRNIIKIMKIEKRHER